MTLYSCRSALRNYLWRQAKDKQNFLALVRLSAHGVALSPTCPSGLADSQQGSKQVPRTQKGHLQASRMNFEAEAAALSVSRETRQANSIGKVTKAISYKDGIKQRIILDSIRQIALAVHRRDKQGADGTARRPTSLSSEGKATDIRQVMASSILPYQGASAFHGLNRLSSREQKAFTRRMAISLTRICR